MRSLQPWCVAALLSVGGCGGVAYKITPIAADSALREVRLEDAGGWGRGKLVMISVDGVISNSAPRGLFGRGEHPVAAVVEQLDAARKDPRVKGVLLRVNSPGGSVTASALLHDELRRFRACGKPIVTMMMDVAASGGYYIACASDEIVAHTTTVTGSIGVIMQTVQISEGLARLGVVTDAITSGPNKDAGSPLRPMAPDERRIFQDIITALYERFVDVVAAGRPQLARERIYELADGRVYTAEQALDADLIDEVGSLRDAFARLRELAADGAPCHIIRYDRPGDWHANIYAHAPVPRPAMQPLQLDIGLPSTWSAPGSRFMYLWQPGR